MSVIGPEAVRLKLAISGVEGYERRIKLQKAAFELISDTPFRSDPVWTKTTEVLRNCLIALDGLDAGWSPRDIAIALFGADRVAEDWYGTTMKNAIRYIVKKAESLRDGGYLVELLGATNAARQ